MLIKNSYQLSLTKTPKYILIKPHECAYKKQLPLKHSNYILIKPHKYAYKKQLSIITYKNTQTYT